MKARKHLYQFPLIYNHKDTNEIFYESIKENYIYQLSHNSSYKKMVTKEKISPNKIKSYKDIGKIPPIPTSLLKRKQLRTVLYEPTVHATSSGTSGMKSHVYYDFGALFSGGKMILRLAKFHKIFSLRPTHYIMLGEKPSKENQMIISKTQFGCTMFAPALSRTYALIPKKQGYKVDVKGLIDQLRPYDKNRKKNMFQFPVRIIGLPSYLYFLVRQLKEEGLQCQLPRGSKILLGGGWKQHYKEEVNKEVFFQEIKEVLGVDKEQCIEFFGIAEHAAVYCSCKNQHFHVPSYSRVIVRDVENLKEVPYGQVGIMNFISPMTKASPLLSIISDDIGVMYPGESCGCGIKTPYFEVLGRVGMENIKTCAISAEELLKYRGEDEKENNRDISKTSIKSRRSL